MRWTEVQKAGGWFDLFRCDECGSDRVIGQSKPPAELYANYYSAEGAERLAGVFNSLWRLKRRSRARLVLRHASRGARVCDVGCERGELLNVLKGAGCQVVGTQLSQRAAEFVRKSFGIEVYAGELMDAPFAQNRFDAVLMLNVLEHVREADRYVAQVSRMLAERGVFWLEIPNKGSFTARLCGKNWLHYDPKHHCWAFDRAGIARLLSRHGIQIEHVYAQSWEFGPIGSLQSWLNWMPGPKNVIYDIVRRGLSHDPGRLALELCQIVLSAVLLPAAVVVSALEGLAGNGQVLLIRARKTGAPVS
jgi:2-polyprenyl-3-methyl-5-hydroxy-6-metoxy-1,4-benzoquinol methylase